MKRIVTSVVILAVSVAVYTTLWGKEGKGVGPETKGFRQEQRREKQTFMRQQQQENKEFKKGLKEMPPEQRAEAIREHHKFQQQEKKIFRQKMHEENMAFLKSRLAAKSKLTDVQKEELINFFEGQYKESVSFRDKQHVENVAFFERIANDPTLTQRQKKEAIRAHFKAQKKAI